MPANTNKKSDFCVPRPVFRRLKGYAFDPSLSLQLDTAPINERIFKIAWEDIEPGPIGEYLEIVDYDPASKGFYKPIDLNDPHILAQDGLSPSEGSPQFHQQMVYAVAMTTIKNFEKALGRKALWSSYREVKVPRKNGKGVKTTYPKDFIRRLRVYPHALRQANAYYSPSKKALLFGYFPAISSSPREFLPNGIVFTCLSHDIIAHETTHALLDGMHRRYIEPSHPDTLAFHEAFADIVALFQHFSFPEVLKHQIAQTRGRLDSQNLLGELAQQFGKAIGKYGALRDAIGTFDKETGEWTSHEPKKQDYQQITEPHARGAILVAAVFEAFLSIYKRRVADLLRIATGGTGILPDGELHPDLVNRLADEAARTAGQILNICIRALDYCPPVDITFGDYLRALITADTDLVPNDDLGYRVALIDAFKRRGIYPEGIRTLSEQSLCWKRFEKDSSEQSGIFGEIAKTLRSFVHQLDYLDELPPDMFDSFSKHFRKFNVENEEDWKKLKEREKIFVLTEASKIALHDLLADFKIMADEQNVEKFEETTGLFFKKTPEKEKVVEGLKTSNYSGYENFYRWEVHSLRGARRVGPDGKRLNQVIISLTQKREVSIKGKDSHLRFRGGCTLILDLEDLSLRYAIVKTIADTKKTIDGEVKIDPNQRLQRQKQFLNSDDGMTLRATYFDDSENGATSEPFAILHNNFGF